MSENSSSKRQFEILPRDETLANRVAVQLENFILERHFKPGDRLPSERELAQQFGVSRTVIREAIRVLVAKDMLVVQPGSGTRIRNPTTQTASQSITLLLRMGQPSLNYEKIFEVRRLLEVEIAGLAAQRRTNEDLTKMETILQEMETILQQTLGFQEERDLYSKADVAFHTALACATQNELFSVLLDSVVEVMLHVRRMGFNVPGSIEHGREYHRRIFEQVKAGNEAEARRAMAEHLVISEDIFRRALAIYADRNPEMDQLQPKSSTP